MFSQLLRLNAFWGEPASSGFEWHFTPKLVTTVRLEANHRKTVCLYLQFLIVQYIVDNFLIADNLAHTMPPSCSSRRDEAVDTDLASIGVRTKPLEPPEYLPPRARATTCHRRESCLPPPRRRPLPCSAVFRHRPPPSSATGKLSPSAVTTGNRRR